MDKRVEISVLLDFYGKLLTEKQRDIMDLYFNKDLSLSEISENTKTSRQAIHDIIKRCEKLLVEYEEKLLLMKKSMQNENIKGTIDEKLNLLTEDNIDREKLLKIVNDIRLNINEIN